MAAKYYLPRLLFDLPVTVSSHLRCDTFPFSRNNTQGVEKVDGKWKATPGPLVVVVSVVVIHVVG